MARRGRKPPVVTHSPMQAGPPQASPLAGEFPAGPVGMMPGTPGPTPPPRKGAANLRTTKHKHQHARGK